MGRRLPEAEGSRAKLWEYATIRDCGTGYPLTNDCWTVVGARTPAVSVGGTVVTGGLSWLSAEYGCISDPDNMLDAQVVKYDGSVVWASSEPDLLWTMRGGGGGFGGIFLPF